MTLKEKVLKLQTYKMFKDEDTVYVERDDILELLEQEPCEDCISRQAVLDCQHFIYDETGEELEVICAENVLNLPSVTPQPKMGRWVDTESDEFEHHHVYQCSNCKQYELIEYPEYVSRFKYCPNCGAKMESEG